MVSTPTRGENVLDLFLTSNHTLVKNTDVLPGISDHDLVLSEVSTKPVETRQPPRSTYLYKRADWEGFKTYKEKVKEDIYANSTSKSVEELLISFKSSVNEGLARFVPCKNIGSKRILPWITQAIKRLIRKREVQRSSRPKHRKQFIATRHMVKAMIKQAYDSYSGDLLGISNPDPNTSPAGVAGESGQSKSASKNYFLF